jgi:hypothetical protein
MPRLWIGNFEFEHRLADPDRTLPAKLQRLNAELAPVWLSVAEDGDAIWMPEPVPLDFWETMAAAGFPRVTPVADWRAHVADYEPTPWGWTPELLDVAARAAPQRVLPSMHSVRTANSRRWSFAWETKWQIGLPHAAACESVDNVQRAIASLPESAAGWVVKAEFGMSGRERLLGRGSPNEAMAAWLQRRLRTDGVVFFEPWVNCIAEAGMLFEVPATDPPQLIGVAEMLPSAQGQYAGSVFAGTSQTNWSTAVDVSHRAAVELQRLGYVGPLGIDAMWYRTADGELALRPLQDVNARWTMGRLALGWRRFFPDATLGVWAHLASGGTSVPPVIPAAPLIIPTSPETMSGHPVHHRTALVVHPRG